MSYMHVLIEEMLFRPIAEEFQKNNEGFTMSHLFNIAALLWVDDVVSAVDGFNV